MEIRFVSSLTREDENLFAPALMKAITALLDQLPIAYTLRVETTGAQVFQHTHAGAGARPDLKDVSEADTGSGGYAAAVPGPARG
jgi:hypothetical protein